MNKELNEAIDAVKYTRTVISLGAGVQSSAMLLMSDRGLIERADYAVFSDTQAEPKEVYEWLNFLKSLVDIPVHIVTKGSLEDDMFNGKHFASVPFFSKMPDGRIGMLRRQCTYEYKIQPMHEFVRREIGCKKGERVKKYGRVKMMIGISRDEVQRMKPSREKWIDHEFPLIDLSYRREDCIRYVEAKTGRTPPRSACIFCPYHNDKEWDRLNKNDPESMFRAIVYEKKLQKLTRWKGAAYLHRSCEPLEKVKFSNTEQIDAFGNECEGMCGV
jgi:hypothetical protein